MLSHWRGALWSLLTVFRLSFPFACLAKYLLKGSRKASAMAKDATNTKKILDPCCGSRMFWFDKQNPAAVYGDCRNESHVLSDGRVLNIAPNNLIDFRSLPYKDNQFSLIVFDPPHIEKAGDKSWLKKKYGRLCSLNWRADLTKGFDECWRVLSVNGTLIFKWNETQIPLKSVLSCFSQKPLFGHTTTQNLKTHWITFHKGQENA